MAVTAKDIAKIVGVSRSAVSAVLNGHHDKVSPEKREKIIAVANDLRYRPNPTALSLAGKPTRTAGLIFSPHISPIYAELLERLVFFLKEQGYGYTLLMPTDAAEELAAIRDLTDRGADGIIVSYAINDIRALDCGIPMVCLSPYPGQYEVRVDLQGGFEHAVRHLQGHGHRRIALVCPNRSSVPMQAAGYEAAMKSAGLKTKKSWTLEVTANPDLPAQLNHLLGDEKITAWVVTNDLLAARFMNHLIQLGKRVPEDAAIIGFDGNAWGRETACPLTTLVFPAAAIARCCVEVLLEKIKTRNLDPVATPKLLKPELYLGGSCGCPVQRASNLYWTGQPLTLDSAGEQGGGFNPDEPLSFEQ